MNPWLALLLGAALAAAPLLFYARRQRRRAANLALELERSAIELQGLQQSCARLAPGNLVDRLITEGAEATAEHKEATALFADLVGYTALSEKLEPKTLARLLNEYFQRMSDAITEHNGHVATFLGDGILAYFGALEPNPWQCNDAVQAALAMRAKLAEYNVELAAGGLPQLALGVGLHYGPGLAGFVGSRERMEYGFVGRTVNLAARVQALTRLHKVDILLTEAVRAKLDPRCELRALPPETLKGIARPVPTYAVLGWRAAGAKIAAEA